MSTHWSSVGFRLCLFICSPNRWLSGQARCWVLENKCCRPVRSSECHSSRKHGQQCVHDSMGPAWRLRGTHLKGSIRKVSLVALEDGRGCDFTERWLGWDGGSKPKKTKRISLGQWAFVKTESKFAQGRTQGNLHNFERGNDVRTSGGFKCFWWWF